MLWTNGKQKPIAAPAAFLRHTNFRPHDYLPKHQLIPTFRITSSRRFRRWLQTSDEKTSDHGKPRSTLLQWCSLNGPIGEKLSTWSWHTNSQTITRKRSTFWFATTNGLKIRSLLIHKDMKFVARTTVGDMPLIQVRHCRLLLQEESDQRQQLTRTMPCNIGARAFIVELMEVWHIPPSLKIYTFNRASTRSSTRGNTRKWATDHTSFMASARVDNWLTTK